MKMTSSFGCKILFLLLFSSGIQRNSFAQENTTTITPSATTIVAPVQKKNIAIGLNIGTKGFVGIDATMHLNRFFNARIALNYANYHYKNDAFKPPVSELEGRQFHLEADYLQSNIELLGEFMPFKGGGLRLVAGAGYFPKNKLYFHGIANKSYLLNDVELDPEEIGGGTAVWTFKSPISPYLGLAFGRAVPRKRLGFSMELGTYFKGSPTIDINATGSLRENDRNEPYINRNFSHFKYLPTISMRLAYRIN